MLSQKDGFKKGSGIARAFLTRSFPLGNNEFMKTGREENERNARDLEYIINHKSFEIRIKRDFLKHKTIKVRDNKLNRRFGVDITPLSR